MYKKLLLFDFDGTVIDNSEGIYGSIRYALKKMGKDAPEENILRKFIGPSLVHSYISYCENNAENAERFVKLYRERYGPVGTTQARLYPGMKKLLCALKKKGATLAVCSGKPVDFVKKIALQLGVYDFFEHYFCPNLGLSSFSKARLILEAVSFYDVLKSEVLMIGDTLYDIRSAKQAGVESLGVLYGFSEAGELKAEGADYIAESVEDIYFLLSGEVLS